LAVLVEMMRREGFELTVGKPRVLTRDVDGVVHEPVDRLTVDVPEEFMGVITQLLALRKGRMEQIVNHGTGWVRLDYPVPAPGPAPSCSPGPAARRCCPTCSSPSSRGPARSGPAPAARSWPTGAARPRATRCSRCRTAASCSSGPASRSTRA